MHEIREILEGYSDPQVKAHALSPVGETGLTVRLGVINFYSQISRALQRRQCYRVGMRFFRHLFKTFQHTTEFAWLSEVARVLDKKETRIGGKVIQNLTVAQCHARFQAELTISETDKRAEDGLHDAIVVEYAALDLEKFRNKRMFHLDLATMLANPPARSRLTRSPVPSSRGFPTSERWCSGTSRSWSPRGRRKAVSGRRKSFD
jgi:hypothetical protein